MVFASCSWISWTGKIFGRYRNLTSWQKGKCLPFIRGNNTDLTVVHVAELRGRLEMRGIHWQAGILLNVFIGEGSIKQTSIRYKL